MDNTLKPTLIDDLPEEVQEELAEFLDRYATGLETGRREDINSFIERYPELRSVVERLVVDVEALCNISCESDSQGDAKHHDASVGLGMVLGDFEIIRELGRGGMGVVYLARQLSLQRQVALKMLPFASILDANQIARFQTEAQAAASLHHPNIVPVYSVGCERGVHYYSMQFIDGRSVESLINSLTLGATIDYSLQESIHSNPLPKATDSTIKAAESTQRTLRSANYVRQIVEKMSDVASALHFAHQRGIIHRDIKPSNLMIDRDGKLWVTDFGLARVQDGQNVTIDGDLIGTLRFMSPEQANGKTHLVDHRTDIYSLGATLYEMLTLTPAFDGTDRFEVMAAIQRANPASSRSINPAIPIDLETIILKCLSPNKDDRYSTAGEVAADLNRFLQNLPIIARRPSLADRLGKWAIRKKKWVAAAAATLLLTTMASVTFTAYVIQQRNRAEMFAANAQLIVDRFGSEFADQLEGIPGTEEVRVRILKQTADYYSQLIEYAKQDSALVANAAHAEHRMAIISQRLGRLDEAGQAFQNALRKWQLAIPADPNNLAKLVAFSSCHRDLALLQARIGDIEAAQSSFVDAMRLIDSDSLKECDDTRLLSEVARTRSEFGLFLAKTDRRQQALELFLFSVEDIEKALNRQSSKGAALLRYQLAFLLNNHATIVMESQPNEARRLLRQAEESLEDSPVSDGCELSNPILAAVLQSNLGVAEGRLDDSQAATDCFQLAMGRLAEILQHYPDYVKAHVEQAACLNNWAQLHLDQREFDKAQKRFEEAEALLISAQTKFPRQPEIPLFLHRVQKNLSVLIESRKRLQNASEDLQEKLPVKEGNLSAKNSSSALGNREMNC